MFKPVIRIEIENKKHFHNLSLFHLPVNTLHCQVHPFVDGRLCHSQVRLQPQSHICSSPGSARRHVLTIAASKQQAGHMHAETKAPNIFWCSSPVDLELPFICKKGQKKSTTISFLTLSCNSMLWFLKIFLQVSLASFRKVYFCSFQICKPKIEFKRSLYIK